MARTTKKARTRERNRYLQLNAEKLKVEMKDDIVGLKPKLQGDCEKPNEIKFQQFPVGCMSRLMYMTDCVYRVTCLY